MFCKNCGNQLSDDAKFCPQCGTSTEGTPVQPQVSAQPAQPAQPAAPAGPTANPLAGIFSNFTILYLVFIGLLVFCFIFSMCETVSLSAFGESESVSLAYCLVDGELFDGEGLEGWDVFTILFYIISLVLAALPLIPNFKFKAGYLWCARFINLWMIVWFFVAIIIMNDLAGGFIDVGPGVLGVFMLIFSIATFVLSFKLGSDIKKSKRAAAQAAQPQSTQQTPVA